MLENWYGNERVTSATVLLDSGNCLAPPRPAPAGKARLGRLIHKCLWVLEDLKSELK
jgi:hypothetical protein